MRVGDRQESRRQASESERALSHGLRQRKRERERHRDRGNDAIGRVREPGATDSDRERERERERERGNDAIGRVSMQGGLVCQS